MYTVRHNKKSMTEDKLLDIIIDELSKYNLGTEVEARIANDLEKILYPHVTIWGHGPRLVRTVDGQEFIGNLSHIGDDGEHYRVEGKEETVIIPYHKITHMELLEGEENS